MSWRLRFPAIGGCLALLCILTAGPATANRGHVRITAPAHGNLGLAPTDGRGHPGAEIEGLVTAVDTGAGTISITDANLGDVVVTVDDSTVIRHGWTVMTLDQISVGARVHVKAAPQDGGGFLATAVFVQNNGAGGSGAECATEVQGTVSAIDCGANSMTVTTDSGDVTVTFDSNTLFSAKGHTAATCDQIRVGDSVEVCGTQGDGSVLAAKVKIEAPESCEDEVAGTASSIDCGAGTLIVTTDASGEVTIALTDATQYFGPHHAPADCADLADGDVVEIEGTLQSDASIVACKVSFQAPDACGDEISGAVSSIDCGAGTMVVTTGSGDVNVALTGTTAYFGKKHVSAACDDVADGDAVEIEGALQGDGSIVACKVSFEPPEVEEAEVSGTIHGTPDGGTRTFLLTTDQGDVTIDVNSDTVIQQRHDLKTFADLADGMSVEVEGILQGDGSILATKISIESKD